MGSDDILCMGSDAIYFVRDMMQFYFVRDGHVRPLQIKTPNQKPDLLFQQDEM